MARLVTSLLIVAILTLPDRAQAGPNSDAVIVLHAVEVIGSDPCLRTSPLPRCYNLNTYVPTLGAPSYVYVLIVNSGSVGGIGDSATIGSASFGISYDAVERQGVDILDWTLCADNALPWNWPSANSGLTVSWNSDNCQSRVTGTGDPYWDGAAAVAGYFYVAVYTSSELRVIPHPEDGKALVADCAGVVDEIGTWHLGSAGFGDQPGYNPCPGVTDVFPCEISGPASVESGSSAEFVASNGNSYLPPGSWRLYGNGTIVGPSTNRTLTVLAGSPGRFTVDYGAPYGPGGYICAKIVAVTEGTPILPMTWGGIKALKVSP